MVYVYRSGRDADRNVAVDPLLWFDSWTRSRPKRICNVRAATLNSILWETGNQRSDLSSGRAFEILGCCSTTRASEFWTRWSFWTDEVGAPQAYF